MKINILSPILILMTCYSSVFAQKEQIKTIKRISIKEIYIQTGLFVEQNSNGSLTDFKTLAPQSVLLNSDFTGYSSSNASGASGNNMFSVMLGIQFSDKQKTTYKANPLLRLGFSYCSGTTLIGSLNKEDSNAYDTLTSNQTGQTLYVDSVTERYYSMNYSSQQLRFDGSLIFRTNPEARWSLFTGLGIIAGFSLNAKTSIFYSKYDNTETRFPNGTIYSSSNSSYPGDNIKKEEFKNKNNFGLSTYIPLGLDFRIGKKREFWKRIHLFYELRPAINITSIPELRSFTNTSVQQGLGLKVSW